MKKATLIITALILSGCASHKATNYIGGTAVLGHKDNKPIYHNLDLNPLDRHSFTINAIITDISYHSALINKNEEENSFHVFNQNTISSNNDIETHFPIIETIPAPTIKHDDSNYLNVDVYSIKVEAPTYKYDPLEILQADRGENFKIGDEVLIQANEFGKWEIFKNH